MKHTPPFTGAASDRRDEMSEKQVDTNELITITPRQLREILFYVQDQDTTIAALRAMLYEVPEQNKAYQVGPDMYHKMAKAINGLG